MADIANLGVVIDPRDAEGGARDVNRALDSMAARARRSMNEIGGVTEKVKGALFSVQGLLASVGIGLGFSRLISVNKNFGASLSELSAITGVVGEDLQGLREEAIRLSGATTFSASSVLEAFKLIASAKSELLDTEGALVSVTEQVLILAQASGEDLPTSATTLATVLNQFQLDANEASRAINVLATAAKVGAAEIPDLARSVKESGTTAKQAGISLEELAASAEVLATGAIRGSEAGTQLRNIILRLQTAGRRFWDVNRGLAGSLDNVRKAQLDATAMVKLFNIENINAAQILMNNTNLLREWTVEVTGTQTAMEQSAAMTDNLAKDMESLGNAVNVLLLNIGEDLVPILRELTQGLKDTVGVVINNYDEIKRWGELIVTVGGYLAAYLISVKALPIAFAAATGAMAVFSRTWATLQLGLATGQGLLVSLRGALLGVVPAANAAAGSLARLNKVIGAIVLVGLGKEIAEWALEFQSVQVVFFHVVESFEKMVERIKFGYEKLVAATKAFFQREPFTEAIAEIEEREARKLESIANEYQAYRDSLKVSYEKILADQKKYRERLHGPDKPRPTPGVPDVPEVTIPEEDFTKQVDRTLNRLLPLRAASEEYFNTIELLNKAREQTVITTEEQTQAEIALHEQYNKVIESLKNLSEESDNVETFADKAARAGERMGNVFASAFEDAVVEMKSLQDVMNSLAEDIIRILARIAITENIQALITAGLGRLTGGGATAGRQSGGSVYGGRLYKVNEREPELLIPSRSGSVVPLSRFLKQASGGQPQNITVAIENKGSPIEARQQQTQMDARGLMIRVITDDVRRGGQISKTLESTYGVRRGGL